MRSIVLSLMLFLGAQNAEAILPDDLYAGVGQTDTSRLTMLFEATIFRVDVANVEARLDPLTAARTAELVAGGDFDEQRGGVEEVLLDADTFTITMEFLRDASWDRFMSGTRGNLERAAEVGVITENEFERLWTDFEVDFASMDNRGVKKGDTIVYRVEGDRVRTIYYDGDGKALVELDRVGDERVRATRGAYFARKSEFSEKLIKSLFEG